MNGKLILKSTSAILIKIISIYRNFSYFQPFLMILLLCHMVEKFRCKLSSRWWFLRCSYAVGLPTTAVLPKMQLNFDVKLTEIALPWFHFPMDPLEGSPFGSFKLGLLIKKCLENIFWVLYPHIVSVNVKLSYPNSRDVLDLDSTIQKKLDIRHCLARCTRVKLLDINQIVSIKWKSWLWLKNYKNMNMPFVNIKMNNSVVALIVLNMLEKILVI